MLLLELEEGQLKWIITWNSNTHGFVLRGAAFIELFSIYYASTSELDCPRSGPGPVRALFADPGPGPQVQVQSFSDLDLDLDTSTAVY